MPDIGPRRRGESGAEEDSSHSRQEQRRPSIRDFEEHTRRITDARRPASQHGNSIDRAIHTDRDSMDCAVRTIQATPDILNSFFIDIRALEEIGHRAGDIREMIDDINTTLGQLNSDPENRGRYHDTIKESIVIITSNAADGAVSNTVRSRVATFLQRIGLANVSDSSRGSAT